MRTFFSLCNSARNRIINKTCERKDFRTNRHIVVFESDDWGSIRMSNRKDWEELRKQGYAVDKRPYERFDTLESPSDLEALFEVLSRHKDSNGNHPVITANMLMANPDYEKIEEAGFQEYHYEPISETYTRYFGDSRVLDIMRQGMDAGVFMSQSHGREHFNVAMWMKGLQEGDEDLLTAFRYGMCGIAPKTHPEKGNQMMNALLAYDESEQKKIDDIVVEGLRMFERQWSFKSKTFVAPCYLWSNHTECVLAENGVRLIQTSRMDKPAYNTPAQYHYTGQNNGYGQVYSVRNCSFEPATSEPKVTIESILGQINTIFAQHKIAVFSTHRINYVSGISEDNRTNTLHLLDQVLTALIKRYPDVEFLSSDKILALL